MQAMARDDFIAAMRNVAHSVSVVTTDGTAGRHGATVSSFCSVSADPPQMLICLHDKSRIARLVRDNDRFCINVLPQELGNVADRFAGRDDAVVADRFDGVEWNRSDAACPSINGAIAFHCHVDTGHVSGSHGVFVGNVKRVEGTFHRPLTYLDGSYRPWSY